LLKYFYMSFCFTVTKSHIFCESFCTVFTALVSNSKYCWYIILSPSKGEQFLHTKVIVHVSILILLWLFYQKGEPVITHIDLIWILGLHMDENCIIGCNNQTHTRWYPARCSETNFLLNLENMFGSNPLFVCLHLG
jgi:hypothetical protein